MSFPPMTPKRLREMNMTRTGPHSYKVHVPASYLVARGLPPMPSSTRACKKAPKVSAPHTDTTV